MLLFLHWIFSKQLIIILEMMVDVFLRSPLCSVIICPLWKGLKLIICSQCLHVLNTLLLIHSVYAVIADRKSKIQCLDIKARQFAWFSLLDVFFLEILSWCPSPYAVHHLYSYFVFLYSLTATPFNFIRSCHRTQFAHKQKCFPYLTANNSFSVITLSVMMTPSLQFRINLSFLPSAHNSSDAHPNNYTLHMQRSSYSICT